MQTMFAYSFQWIVGFLLILSSLGVVLARKPVYSSLSFLLTLLSLSALYLQLSAQFIAAMQVLVYAGAILVIFIFVIILFQDAHEKMHLFQAKSTPLLLLAAALLFSLSLVYLGQHLVGLAETKRALSPDFGTVQSLGSKLYLDFFFPFEAVTLLFLIAIVGALYIARK